MASPHMKNMLDSVYVTQLVNQHLPEVSQQHDGVGRMNPIRMATKRQLPKLMARGKDLNGELRGSSAWSIDSLVVNRIFQKMKRRRTKLKRR